MEDILIGNGIRVNGRDYEIVGATGGDVYSEGGPNVFEVFNTSPYQYLKIKKGGAAGKRIESMHSGEGIFKMRSGMVRTQNAENSEQGATLHIKPSESFLSNVPSNREHYRLTLLPAKFLEMAEIS